MARQRDGKRRQMNRQSANDQRFLFLYRRNTPQHGSNARHHLAWRKGLHNVIIRADIQSKNAVRIFVFRGNHQNRNARYPTDAAADLQPVYPRQHDIQQNQRRPGRVKQVERLLSGSRRQHRPAFFFNVLRQNIHDLLVVVHHQNRIHNHPSVVYVLHTL